MNRQQAKELLPVIQAFAEGKIVQFKNAFGNWTDCDGVLFNYPPKDYRIKPEPQYRPFKNAQECWEEMQKHQPFGWVKGSENNRLVISAIRDEGVCINGSQYWSYYDSMFNKYPFADDTPFGIKE